MGIAQADRGVTMSKTSAMSLHSDRMVEWMFAAMMTVWGLWLLNPYFTTFTSPSYAPLATLFPEWVWGAWSVSIGTVRLIALYINGRYRRTPILRIVCAVLGMAWWIVLIYLVAAQGAPFNPPAGFSWYFVFVIFEGISCFRAAGDAFHLRAFDRPKSGFLRVGT